MICAHWLGGHAGIGELSDQDVLARWNPPFVKLVCLDETPPFTAEIPEAARIVIRIQPMSEMHGLRGFTSLTQAANRGYEHAEVCERAAIYLIWKGIAEERIAFEGLNEPQLWSNEGPELTAEYYRAFLQGLHGFGLHGVVGNFGVGWPGGKEAPDWRFFQPVIDIMQPGDYLGLHEYWSFDGPNTGWSWWAGRYERCPFQVPILITECGIDDAVTGVGGTRGWRELPDLTDEQRAARYVNDLWGYARTCAMDWRVRGVFPYTYGSSGVQWQSMDIRNEVFFDAFWRKLDAEGLPQPGKMPEEEPMATDPRDLNCRAVHVNAEGKVDGVKLAVLPMPPAQYVCKQVSLIDEEAAQGQTTCQVQVVNATGLPVLGVKVYLAWPWDGVSTTFQEKALPGNTNYPPNHVIVNGYDANRIHGPLAIFVGDNAGNINSEVVAGLGLPWNRHVSFSILFQERGAVTPPPTDPGDPGTPVDPAVVPLLTAMLAELRKLNVHLGVE